MRYKQSAFLVFALLPFIGCTSDGQTVSRYIEATQKRDFKTVIDLTYSYQQDLKGIRAQNPQSLWSNLVSSYYQQRTSEMQREPAGLLRSGCKWTITEKRNGNMLGSALPLTITYVTISYPTIEDSPIAPRRLRQTVLAFNVASGLVVSVDRLAAGDVFWPIPPLTTQIAHDTILTQMSDTALHFHLSFPVAEPAVGDQQPWLQIGVPWVGPTWDTVKTWHANYRQFLQQRGFQVGEFDESFEGNGKGSKAQPPQSWAKYRLGGPDRQNPGFPVTYRIDEKTDAQILNIDLRPEAGTATARIRLTHDGCNEICNFVLDIHKTPQLAPVGRDTWGVWGNNGWGLYGDSQRDRLNWPSTEEGSIGFVWDQVKLRWTIPETGFFDVSR